MNAMDAILTLWREQRPFYAVIRHGVLYCYELVWEKEAGCGRNG